MASHLLKRPIDPVEFQEVVRMAKEEDHLVLHPSHVLIKDREVMGYCSIASIPLVTVFFAKKCKPLDSIRFIKDAEIHLRALGQNHYFTLCTDNSPFYPLMESLRFKKLFSTNLMTKDI